MNKKIISILLILAMMCLILVSCNGTNDTDTNSQINGGSNGQLTDKDTSVSKDTTTDTTVDSDSDATVDSDDSVPPEPQAPNITILDYNGNEVTLDSLKGKPIVLNFWASWCPPCKAEMPDFEEAYKKYGNDVNFIMVSHLAWGNDTVESAKAFYEQSGYTFPVYFDTRYEGYFVYELESIPRTVIINADGTIYKYYTGMISYQMLEEAIETVK